MQKITTATGKTFSINWCGPSTIDMALRFAVSGSDIGTVFQVFTDPAETAELTHTFDERETTFHGFTFFKGVNIQPDGEIVVALMEG